MPACKQLIFKLFYFGTFHNFIFKNYKYNKFEEHRKVLELWKYNRGWKRKTFWLNLWSKKILWRQDRWRKEGGWAGCGILQLSFLLIFFLNWGLGLVSLIALVNVFKISLHSKWGRYVDWLQLSQKWYGDWL